MRTSERTGKASEGAGGFLEEAERASGSAECLMLEVLGSLGPRKAVKQHPKAEDPLSPYQPPKSPQPTHTARLKSTPKHKPPTSLPIITYECSEENSYIEPHFLFCSAIFIRYGMSVGLPPSTQEKLQGKVLG